MFCLIYLLTCLLLLFNDMYFFMCMVLLCEGFDFVLSKNETVRKTLIVG